MRDVRSFIVLAEQLHFGRAAKLLHVSQPALTKQIHRLEEEFGGVLLDRGRHGTRLSSLGIKVLADAKGVLREFDRFLAGAKSDAAGDTGRLRIGFGFHTFDLVPRVIVEMRRKAPAIQISLRDMSTLEQILALRAEQIDVGFLRSPIDREFESFPVTTDRLALVCGATSGLPKQVTLEDCRDQPFVMISEKRAPGFHRHFLRLCAASGFHPQIVQEVPEVTTALALVRAGLGVAVIPQSFRMSRFTGIWLSPLAGPDAEWSVGAAWRRGDSNPLLHRFLELIRRDTRTNAINH
ncbi:MAG TPA: LysR family transcriptional regulator [Candidatus Limnocylindria bacterium]|nr:LysR family transcriptional regulator [Candidatus Limnocylindria bacterium]